MILYLNSNDRHFTFDNHSRISDPLVISQNVWASLSPEEQGWLRQAAQESSRFQRDLWESEAQKAIAAMKAGGVAIQQVNLAAFRDRTASVRKRCGTGPLGELVSKIPAQLNNLANDLAHAAIFRQLNERLTRTLIERRDPRADDGKFFDSAPITRPQQPTES